MDLRICPSEDSTCPTLSKFPSASHPYRLPPMLLNPPWYPSPSGSSLVCTAPSSRLSPFRSSLAEPHARGAGAGSPSSPQAYARRTNTAPAFRGAAPRRLDEAMRATRRCPCGRRGDDPARCGVRSVEIWMHQLPLPRSRPHPAAARLDNDVLLLLSAVQLRDAAVGDEVGDAAGDAVDDGLRAAEREECQYGKEEEAPWHGVKGKGQVGGDDVSTHAAGGGAGLVQLSSRYDERNRCS
ncbi:hypothetical protein MSAN_01220400 [Mycena sanguinolenta]|uniref:Uncharacterized protein n=1 Tax=Mycena sanguinolenta TaxID=230812 RepID=A0A8H7D4N8_9AGAR|nr:hypothetical protein MSAN_01220400 [Mycena sanguinolenta]